MGLSYVKLHEKNDATKISSLAALELELWPLNPMYDPGALFANFFSARPKWTFHSLKDAEKWVYKNELLGDPIRRIELEL